MIWRNLWRNRRRTWITTASITFSIFLAISMQSFKKGTFDHLIQNVVSYYSGFIQVHQQGYWDEQVLDNCFETSDSLFAALEAIPGVLQYTPRIETFMLASVASVTKGCMLVGTDPEREIELTGVDKRVVKGAFFKAGDESVLMAEGLAARLKLSVGDTLVLFGQGFRGTLAAGKYPVAGIIHFASPQMNDNMLYLPLTTAQYLLNAENRLTSVSLKIDHPDNMEVIRQRTRSALHENYEVMTWEEMMPEIANHIKADNSNAYIYTGILYLIIGFGFFGTILMMTAERRYELGMLIAIGMKKSLLGLILLGEIFLITLIGIIAGFLVSLPLVFYFKYHPIRFTGQMGRAYEQFGFEALMPATFDPRIFLIQSCIVFGIALLIGLYPFWHIHRLDPIRAMK